MRPLSRSNQPHRKPPLRLRSRPASESGQPAVPVATDSMAEVASTRRILLRSQRPFTCPTLRFFASFTTALRPWQCPLSVRASTNLKSLQSSVTCADCRAARDMKACRAIRKLVHHSFMGRLGVPAVMWPEQREGSWVAILPSTLVHTRSAKFAMPSPTRTKISIRARESQL